MNSPTHRSQQQPPSRSLGGAPVPGTAPMQAIRIGQTLPLFESLASPAPKDSLLHAKNRPLRADTNSDQHMLAALELAKNLRKRGRRTPRNERQQTGIAICRHLAASLQLQAEQEAQTTCAKPH